jgi:hypothetical protein
MLAHVLTEDETLTAVERGMSLARYGDGEMNLIRGGNCVSQVHTPALQEELQRILKTPVENLLVGVPRLCKGPKDHLWEKWKRRFTERMNPKMTYGSAFISRPDSAPWIKTVNYFERVRQLWAEKHVTFVGNGQRSLTPDCLYRTGAVEVDFVQSSYAHSYEQIDELEQRVLAMPSTRVILCCGPTATCLAARLAVQKHHAIDLGHIGMFWPK